MPESACSRCPEHGSIHEGSDCILLSRRKTKLLGCGQARGDLKKLCENSGRYFPEKSLIAVWPFRSTSRQVTGTVSDRPGVYPIACSILSRSTCDMPDEIESERAIYLDASQCGKRFGFSARHWIRLVDRRRAPQPIRFGRLTRWSVRTLEEWEADGCPRCHQKSGR